MGLAPIELVMVLSVLEKKPIEELELMKGFGEKNARNTGLSIGLEFTPRQIEQIYTLINWVLEYKKHNHDE